MLRHLPMNDMLTKQIHQQLRLAIAVAVTNISPAWAGIFPRLSQALPNCGTASAPSWMTGISCRAALYTSRDPERWIITPPPK